MQNKHASYIIYIYVNLHCKSFDFFHIRAVFLLYGMKKRGIPLQYILK